VCGNNKSYAGIVGNILKVANTIFNNSVNSGGFYASSGAEQVLLGDNLKIWRSGPGGVGTPWQGESSMVEMKVTEIRAYGLPNLLQTQSVTVEAPTVSTVKYSKDALIDSAPERSCFTGKSPFTDTSGT